MAAKSVCVRFDASLLILVIALGCHVNHPTSEVPANPQFEGTKLSLVRAVADVPEVAFVLIDPTAEPPGNLLRSRHAEGPPGSTSQHFLEIVELTPAQSANVFTIFLPSPCVVQGKREVAIASSVAMYGTSGPPWVTSPRWWRARVVDVASCLRTPRSGMLALAGSHEALRFLSVDAFDTISSTDLASPEMSERVAKLPEEERAILRGAPNLAVTIRGVRAKDGSAVSRYQLFESLKDTHRVGDVRLRRDGVFLMTVGRGVAGFFEANGEVYVPVESSLIAISHR